MVSRYINKPPLTGNFKTYFDTLRNLGAASGSLQPIFRPDMEEVRRREKEYTDYLGSTDYASRLQESEELSKLRLALSLAQRGFAAMGAQPQRGESPIGVVARTLVSPLAGDVSTVAGQLMQQRQAAKLAEEKEKRQVRLAALTAVGAEQKSLANLAKDLMPSKKAADKGPFEGLKWVLKEDEDGNLQHVGENN